MFKTAVRGYYQVTDKQFVPANYFIHPQYDKFKIKRVMLAPVQNETSYPEAVSIIEPIFLQEISKTNRFDIVPGSEFNPEEFHEFGIHQKGMFYKLQLFDIGKRYNADAVIFTSITTFFPYEPCKVGLNTQMIHTATGTVLWAFSETFDANMREVETLAKQYYFENLRFAHPLYDWKIVVTSIRYFAQMACAQTAGTLYGYSPEKRLNSKILNTVTAIEDADFISEP